MSNNKAASGTAMGILFALSLAHFMNDAFQSLISAVYPVLRVNLKLTYGELGKITLIYQICASVFQPVFGVVFDKKPSPWYLPAGTCSTLTGLLILAYANSLFLVMVAVAFVGLGSSILHPEASRLTHIASGGKHGLAQSIFQVGGNFGSSMGPLLAAFIIIPYGQKYIAVFSFIAFLVIFFMYPICKWYKDKLKRIKKSQSITADTQASLLSGTKIIFSLSILLVLIFSKYVYMASITNFYTFYLMEKFSVTPKESQYFLFVFLFAAAAGTFLGGPLGDRIGRKYVIWGSILGAAPFTLLMPYMDLMGTAILSFLIGLILSSAFSAILVYAQELLPTKLGLISGLFFGLAFGIAGIAAAVLGNIADSKGIEYVYQICSYMPLLGLITVFLPNIRKQKSTS